MYSDLILFYGFQDFKDLSRFHHPIFRFLTMVNTNCFGPTKNNYWIVLPPSFPNFNFPFAWNTSFPQISIFEVLRFPNIICKCNANEAIAAQVTPFSHRPAVRVILITDEHSLIERSRPYEISCANVQNEHTSVKLSEDLWHTLNPSTIRGPPN